MAYTVDTIGDAALTASIIDRSITELHDNLVTQLGEEAMRNCKALKKVILESVTKLGEGAFYGCEALETVDIHQQVTITKDLFYGCKALKALILRSETLCPMTYTSAIDGTQLGNSGTGYTYVPRALVEEYKAAGNWMNYPTKFRAIEDYPEVCDPYSWTAVSKHLEAGTYKDVYKIGDSVPVDLGSEGIINMQIAAFDADTLADGTGTAAISWVAKELLKTKHRMNPAKVDGTEGTGSLGGWEKSEMRAYLKENIKSIISADAQSMIKTVAKTQSAYDTAGVRFTQITEDDVWIPSADEINSANYYRALLYTDTTKLRKYTTSGATGDWWLRQAGDPVRFGIVSGTSLSYTDNAEKEKYVCLGFCTGRTPA